MKISQRTLDVLLIVIFFISLALLAITIVLQQSRMTEYVAPVTRQAQTGAGADTQATTKSTAAPEADSTKAQEAAKKTDMSGWVPYESAALGISLKVPKETYVGGEKAPFSVKEDAKNGTIDLDGWWTMKVAAVKNEKALDAFINSYNKELEHGAGCRMGEKAAWANQAGVYKVKLTGEDWDNGVDLGSTTCSWSYPAYILYAPEKGKAIYIGLRQDTTFTASDNVNDSQDEGILDSIRFE